MSAITLTIALALSSFTGTIQANRSPLVAGVETGEYFAETYIGIRGRGATAPLFLFFSGEPIKVRVIVVNIGSDIEELVLKTANSEEIFAVEARHNEQLTTVRLTRSVPRLILSDGREGQVDARSTPRLRPRERIEWTVEIQEPLLPGSYRLRIQPNAVDRLGREVVSRSSTFEFEIRPSSAEAQPEIARRDAWRQFLAGDTQALTNADLAVERLLKVHPTSYEAFLIRGHIAKARGDANLAAANYDRAIDILRRDQDDLLVKFKSRQERDTVLQSVEVTTNRKPQ